MNWSVKNLAVTLFVLTGCAVNAPSPADAPLKGQPAADIAAADIATVTAVDVAGGEPGAYTFGVTIRSPDTGCEQYSDWWEVIDKSGQLIYRRILAHSHVDEQPFRRTGGPIAILPEQTVIVRAHMHPQGYGTQAFQGSVEAGFTEIETAPGFASALSEISPQPSGCAF